MTLKLTCRGRFPSFFRKNSLPESRRLMGFAFEKELLYASDC
jgi:hypothetical protein